MKTSSNEIAASDPVLVSNILMMVNSSCYGMSRKIDNLWLAIVCISELIVNRFEHPDNPLKYSHPRFFKLLGLDPEIDRAIIPELSRKLDRVGGFLDGLE